MRWFPHRHSDAIYPYFLGLALLAVVVFLFVHAYWEKRCFGGSFAAVCTRLLLTYDEYFVAVFTISSSAIFWWITDGRLRARTYVTFAVMAPAMGYLGRHVLSRCRKKGRSER